MSGITFDYANSDNINESYGVSREYYLTLEGYINACEHFYSVPSRENAYQRFNRLRNTWLRETAIVSSLHEIYLNPSYQQIIAMGKHAIPFILADLKKEPKYWFWALEMITGENPVKSGDQGHLNKMTEEWLKWGERKDLC